MPIRPNDYLPLTGDVDYEVVTGHIGTYDGAWDGHDDVEKWRRVAACFAGQVRVMEAADGAARAALG